MRSKLMWIVALAIGCGDAGDGDGTSASSEGGPSSSAGTTTMSVDTSAGTTSGSDESADTGIDPTDGGGLSHGFVQLRLARAESATEDPFVGTAQVIAVLQYAECLTAFYDANPNLRQDGPDGAAIFGGDELGGEGWLDRLCSPAIVGHVDCSVDAIVQDLGATKRLTVVYTVSGPIEDGLLLFGPLPTEATAMCDGGVQPIVRVASTDAVTGNAENGTQLWGTESFSPSEAVTNQMSPIQIHAVAVGG
ncbi:MAG TPA: hypothetical protein VG755_36730 [Nannocystaceae bacterium]|nr:hypothetical protein [Nannocystaceae bacterium]